MTENLDAIIRRIQKLLAIANHERSDINEASAAAAMAEKIMRKYQLENSDFIISSLTNAADDSLTEETFNLTAKTNGTLVKALPLWANWLATAVAELHDCRIFTNKMRTGEIRIHYCGYAADVAVAKHTALYLAATINRLCDDFKKTPAYQTNGRAAVNSYRQGVAAGIVSNLQASRKAKNEQTTSTGTSLVVAKAAAVEARYGKNEIVSKAPTLVTEAFTQGLSDGRSVSINPALNKPEAGRQTLR